MSADNYVLVRKEKECWVGYLESASLDDPTYNTFIFKVDTLIEAIKYGQEINTEYGMRFALNEGELKEKWADYTQKNG
jgi:hypothetical protein